MKEKNSDIAEITSLSKLADVLRRRKKRETLEERLLRSYANATVWNRGKKVVEHGKVIDEEWLRKKLMTIRGRRHAANYPDA